MGKARILLTNRSFKFRCEGSAKWADSQLAKVLTFLSSSGAAGTSAAVTSGSRPIRATGADVLEHRCDFLVLKYAQSFYGADRAVAKRLTAEPARLQLDGFRLPPGQHALVNTKGLLAARRVLFVGVPPLREFDYDAIQSFGQRALRLVAESTRKPASVAMTIHGVGYGLDEERALEAQLDGFQRGLALPSVSNRIKDITLVEHDEQRAARLAVHLSSLISIQHS